MSLPGISIAAGLVVGIGYLIYTILYKERDSHYILSGSSNEGRCTNNASSSSYKEEYDDDAYKHVKQAREQSRALQCTICLEDLRENQVALKCGHKFHTHCMANWAREKRSCPICLKAL